MPLGKSSARLLTLCFQISRRFVSWKPQLLFELSVHLSSWTKVVLMYHTIQLVDYHGLEICLFMITFIYWHVDMTWNGKIRVRLNACCQLFKFFPLIWNLRWKFHNCNLCVFFIVYCEPLLFWCLALDLIFLHSNRLKILLNLCFNFSS